MLFTKNANESEPIVDMMDKIIIHNFEQLIRCLKCKRICIIKLDTTAKIYSAVLNGGKSTIIKRAAILNKHWI